MPASNRPSAPVDRIAFAVGVIILTVLALSLGDALIKFTSGSFVIWQVFVLRSVIVLPVLFGYLLIFKPSDLRLPDALGWTILRSLMLVGMWVAYYLALPHLDLSIAAAVYYTLPIFITLFSALFIGDRISGLGWAAVAMGFVGVLMILRPEADDFNLYALLPLLAAVLYALAMILTRTKCRSVPPVMLSIALNVGFIMVGGTSAIFIEVLFTGTRDGFLLAPWAEMGPAEWVSVLLLASAVLIGSVGAAYAYQNGPPAVIGVFDFAYVGFAVLWGLIFFDETPDIVTLFGIGLIVLAGVLSVRQ